MKSLSHCLDYVDCRRKDSTTDLKIDWVWHQLINVLRILKPEISQFVMETIQVIGPTLLYFSKQITFFAFLFHLYLL